MLYQSGLEVLGMKERRNEDWFEANWQKIEPVVEAKRKARLAQADNPCPASRDALRAARSKCQQTARRCANDYWHQLSRRIQSAADTGNTGSMYAGIKDATGPSGRMDDSRIPKNLLYGELADGARSRGHPS